MTKEWMNLIDERNAWSQLKPVKQSFSIVSSIRQGFVNVFDAKALHKMAISTPAPLPPCRDIRLQCDFTEISGRNDKLKLSCTFEGSWQVTSDISFFIFIYYIIIYHPSTCFK